MTRAAMLHTAPALRDPLHRRACAALPGLDLWHVVDEGLLADAVAHGAGSDVRRRLATHLGLVQERGARAVLVTCSSLGEAVEQVRGLLDVPVLRIDEPMAAAAVRRGRRVGVLATLASTLEPTSALLRRCAARTGVDDLVLRPAVVEDAADAARCGDAARHDELVRAAVAEHRAAVDVVVLAQASMARAVEGDEAVLSSPDSGVRAFTEVLAAAG